MMRLILAMTVCSGLMLAQSKNPVGSENEGGFSKRHGYQAHRTHNVAASDRVAIEITINPEARVSVARVGTLPAGGTCGQPLWLPIRIVNQGFVTAPLTARLVDSVPNSIQLDFASNPLQGIPEEHRTLSVTMNGPGAVDVTIAFHAKSDIPELGGRDRVAFLLRCWKAD